MSDRDRQTRFFEQRQGMVVNQLKRRGIASPQVLSAMGAVPRERFVSEELAPFAYDDRPLPLLQGQTISQPYIVAVTIEALGLKGGEKILEIGTGCGYAAAVASQIALKVVGIERLPVLAAKAEMHLRSLGYDNIQVECADGHYGWPALAPYDGIMVAAAAEHVPPALKEQLAEGGRLVIPLGRPHGPQELVRIVRSGPDSYQKEKLLDVAFVPLVSD